MVTQRVLQNNRLLWIDANIRDDNADTQHTLEKLRTIVHQIDLFTQIEDSIRFLKNVQDEQALIITSGSLGSQLLKQIHHLPQVEAIYIFCGDPGRHQNWTNQWSKIRGVYNRIKPICEALRIAVKQTNEDLTPISFVTRNIDDENSSTVDLNRLEPSFMYTTLFKRIFLTMKHELDEKKVFINFCRKHLANNPVELNFVEEFDRSYQPEKAIWWYTRECFIYEMLNRALRLLESDIIVDMGFFIHDLHRNIEQLHQKQFSKYQGPPMTLYRGQGLPTKDFDKLSKNQGGLLAFNSFLSTSTNKSVSMSFARENSLYDQMIGILFLMTVDPMLGSAKLANVTEHSFYRTEDEVLLSMHTVFRIGDIIQLDEQKQLFEVRLLLTTEDDPELSRLTNRMEEDIGDGSGWERLGRILLNMGKLIKAEELFLSLLEQKPSESYQGIYFHHLGVIKDRQGDYRKAVGYCQRAISIREKICSASDPSLAISYDSIGSIYSNMGEYSQALWYYKKSLAIQENTLPVDHPSLATSYNNIGLVYDEMEEYFQALSYYDRALAIQEKTLPSNHPHISTSYNNIGTACKNIGEYSQALFSHIKALEIRERTLPSDHPHLAQSYNNIGAVFNHMEEYSQALSYYHKAITIWENTLSSNHPSLATSYNNIGAVYKNTKDYPKALLYFDKALTIRKTTLPDNHPSLACSYHSIGVAYYKMKEYSKAQLNLQKALEIRKISLPSEHSKLQKSLKWIDDVNKKLHG